MSRFLGSSTKIRSMRSPKSSSTRLQKAQASVRRFQEGQEDHGGSRRPHGSDRASVVRPHVLFVPFDARQLLPARHRFGGRWTASSAKAPRSVRVPASGRNGSCSRKDLGCLVKVRLAGEDRRALVHLGHDAAAVEFRQLQVTITAELACDSRGTPHVHGSVVSFLAEEQLGRSVPPRHDAARVGLQGSLSGLIQELRTSGRRTAFSSAL